MKKYGFKLSRRKLMAGVACASVTSSAAIRERLPSQDAELIALGHQFDHLTKIWDELARRTNHTYDNVDIIGLIETLDPIEAAIVATRAKTIEGLLVKARAANWSREGRIHPETESSTDKKMAWSIVRDLIDLTC